MQNIHANLLHRIGQMYGREYILQGLFEKITQQGLMLCKKTFGYTLSEGGLKTMRMGCNARVLHHPATVHHTSTTTTHHTPGWIIFIHPAHWFGSSLSTSRRRHSCVGTVFLLKLCDKRDVVGGTFIAKNGEWYLLIRELVAVLPFVASRTRLSKWDHSRQ